MKTITHSSDEGLIIRKFTLKESHQQVTLLSKYHGRMTLTAYGSKKLTSKRLSHLETGNVIRFSWREEGGYMTLSETDLMYAHSHIKEDSQKLDYMYLILFILNRILPEDEPETEIYSATLAFFKRLHASQINMQDVEVFLKDILMRLGFMDEEQVADQYFEVIPFVEGLIGRKVGV